MKWKKVVKIKYASIRNFDISNGEGVGISLFVQGCPFHCYNCFNPNTWDFNGGEEWTKEVEDKFIESATRSYIERISILGGEPLANENLDGVLNLVNKIRLLMPEKTIWLYSGYTWEQIMYPIVTDDLNIERNKSLQKRKELVSLCDILVDGRYIDSKHDITLKWKGSSNQRVINIQKSLLLGEVVLWEQ